MVRFSNEVLVHHPVPGVPPRCRVYQFALKIFRVFACDGSGIRFFRRGGVLVLHSPILEYEGDGGRDWEKAYCRQGKMMDETEEKRIAGRGKMAYETGEMRI